MTILKRKQKSKGISSERVSPARVSTGDEDKSVFILKMFQSKKSTLANCLQSHCTLRDFWRFNIAEKAQLERKKKKI